eukprot:CAMPEP_0201889628 /NCGR_PEP_ID=MMETSP0902-20130614/30446_1 /ASSEMBLY_ACC=CAM_ASM_000551 /TAXON_ID=420261 /ORGANISM="Thalassiosira antarctica, Strain CCMP982" /LENGTH=296 /DNA_ID=CAMNT_0048420265 /DNA_START=99 /DNA_END=989 /DNA_ORIENTATION=-
MNEPRDSPQRRKQFLVISAIMVVLPLHAALNAGVLTTLAISEGTFPGGEFVYKSMMKDYAASTGTLRTVSADLGIAEDGGSGNLIIREEGVPLDTADLLYSILLDDTGLVPGGMTRFMSGALLAKSSEGGKKMKKMLLEVNKDVKEEGGTHSKETRYEVGSLPKVDAAVAQHPFTAGAWSAILQSYKIAPKFKEYAKDHGEPGKSPIVIATCSAKQKMCTYYMPLSKRDKFYMGKPITEEYAKEFDNLSQMQMMGFDFNVSGISIRVANVVRGMKKALGMGGGSKKESASDNGDEL